jgi:hypothetical protein
VLQLGLLLAVSGLLVHLQIMMQWPFFLKKEKMALEHRI